MPWLWPWEQGEAFWWCAPCEPLRLAQGGPSSSKGGATSHHHLLEDAAPRDFLAILPAFFAQHLNPTGVAAIVGNGHSRVLTWHFAQAREVLQLRPRSGGFCLEDVPPLTSLCSFTTFGPFKTQRRVANGRTFYGTYISIEAVIKGSSKSSLVGLILWGAVSSNRIKAGLLPSEVSSPALSGLRQAPPRRLSCQSTV